MQAGRWVSRSACPLSVLVRTGWRERELKVEIDPVVFAAAQARRFTGRRLRVGRSAVVHDVAWKAWLGDLALPVAACNQGWAGLAAADDLTATDDPANCRKCALAGSRAAARRAPPFQTTLFDLDTGGGGDRPVPGSLD
ncbi:hypothetical protein DMP14_20540 [Pseudonocardia sp. Ae707_Ps2]